MDSKGVFRSIASELDAVERELGGQAQLIVKTWSLDGRSAEHIARVVQHIFQKPGKMLRPALVLLSGGIASSEGITAARRPILVRLAAAVELIHSASLIHDDIIDGEELRRRQPTLNKCYGDQAAVLAGDILYSRSFALITDLELPRWEQHLEIFRLLCETTQKMCLGEIGEQQALDQGLRLSFPEYLEILKNKTAALMSACCASAAIACDAGGQLIETLASFGLSFGLAFQLLDDASDKDALVSPGSDIAAEAMGYLSRARSALERLQASPYLAELLAACDYVLSAGRP